MTSDLFPEPIPETAASMPGTPLFADVILPLALPKRTYTYALPADLASFVVPGVRVEVQFGANKVYGGLVERVHRDKPDYKLKQVLAVLDEVTVVSPRQLQLWDWIASYYCCTLGEVMHAALPAHLKLTSETKLVFNAAFGEDFSALDADGYLLAEALLLQQEVTISDARKILNKKTIFPAVQRLLQLGVLFLREDLQEKFRPRRITGIRLAAPYKPEGDTLRQAFDLLSGSKGQTEILLAYLQLAKRQPAVRKLEVLARSGVSDAVLKSVVKKGILETYDLEISRLPGYEDELVEAGDMSAAQLQALTAVRQSFENRPCVLLHGVTGSGKTRLYMELIREVIREGGQVLYLLPEIALTTQLVARLQRVFGADVAVYHSRLSYNERVELWRSAASGKPLLVGARSGLFLPLKDLKLVIVDEEHDPSFKQYDPAPRYNARDAAIFLANLHGAKVLLGTATPALETYHNARTGKYGYVEMAQRFGGLQMPAIDTIDLREQHKARRMQGMFSEKLLEALRKAVANGEQAILFQNRRGFAPILECKICGWSAGCRHCDVSLTYHKHGHQLKCHYCGYQQEVPSQCPACGSGQVLMLGFGTEKVEDELKTLMPEARIGRMDLDTVGGKNKMSNLLQAFEERQLDVLIGTQMVTKGLDFDNVGLVGVLGADQLIRFPDFRAGERAFQLLTQVAGRAGRKHKRGAVLIQAFHPTHPVLREVVAGDYAAFAQRELAERNMFLYPPFARLIQLTLRHKDDQTVREAAGLFAAWLREMLGDRVLGPVAPPIGRVRNLFAQTMLLKLDKSGPLLEQVKNRIRRQTEVLNARAGFGQVQVAVDVDPV